VKVVICLKEIQVKLTSVVSTLFNFPTVFFGFKRLSSSNNQPYKPKRTQFNFLIEKKLLQGEYLQQTIFFPIFDITFVFIFKSE